MMKTGCEKKKNEAYFSLRLKEGLVGAAYKKLLKEGQSGGHPEEEHPRAEVLSGLESLKSREKSSVRREKGGGNPCY